jgi:hypothetical protein
MGVFSRFRRRKAPYQALTDEERISRYIYLLNTLPASVIESAHATAFKDLSPERRREMFEQLRPFMAESERDAASDDPTVLAKLVRRAEEHRARRAAGGGADAATGVATATAVRPTAGDPDAQDDRRDDVDVRGMLATSGVMLLVANNVLVSSAVMSYYTVGAGSLHLGAEPGWVGETYDPGAGGLDGGGFGGGGDFGGGVDGGGFSGGFDGGGFGGGGFDGGGGGFG